MKKRVIILVVSLIAITGIIIGVSYAFFSTGGSQETANTFQSGCLNISLTDASASISLSNIYPITDIEGLEGTSYDFTITNTCNTDANYEINLESLNQASNSLSADYIKLSLSSDTVGNVISILSDNTSVTPEVANAYEAYNLYTGTLGASETKTYHLKLWLDYDATVEQAANKVYSSKINVVANPEIQVVDTLEAKFTLEGTALTSSLTANVTNASYCITSDNICSPTENANISNNSYTINLENEYDKVLVCTKLNGTSKTICSSSIIIKRNLEEEILANKTIETRTDFTQSLETDTTGTIFQAEDDLGTSYYFAGAPTDNWVQFGKWSEDAPDVYYGYTYDSAANANLYEEFSTRSECEAKYDNCRLVSNAGKDMYWRIIRINGNGSIRMIYAGTMPVHLNNNNVIGFSAFNELTDDNAYVGYMYGTVGSSTYEETHANINDSTIKAYIDKWFEENMLSYNDKIDKEAGFCAGRNPYIRNGSGNYTYTSGSGMGTDTTFYETFTRLYTGNAAGINPNFKCSNSDDLYTISESSQGNKVLTYPVGLINADEVSYAGGVSGLNNFNYYLNIGQNYWTMSPSYFRSNIAYMYLVRTKGYLSAWGSYYTLGVRPVINLKSTVMASGNGTAENPYVIAT